MSAVMEIIVPIIYIITLAIRLVKGVERIADITRKKKRYLKPISRYTIHQSLD